MSGREASLARKPFFDSAVVSAPYEHKFQGDERHLYDAARRHIIAAAHLATRDDLLLEAMFHARLAGECLLKHLFCLLRLARGVRADVPADFAELKIPRRVYGHNAKQLGRFLLENPEFKRATSALADFVLEFPGGENWSNERYAGDVRPGSLRQRFDDFMMLVERLWHDIDEGVEDAQPR